ncbi:hypothetical protein [Ferrimonas pelagia]|uniref:Uncharacterized protein n=1 Tax=Ferrimonas pelagia TaxID=1177826 RepID=A0ABP9EVD9_9GAMM
MAIEIAPDDQVEGLKYIEMTLAEPDKNGRCRPQPWVVRGSDLMVTAIDEGRRAAMGILDMLDSRQS